jgi:mannose-6-phosphate isomerase-like protein (cupin superfamily)
MKSSYRDAPAFTTKDGSTIRELMHPGRHAHLGVRTQSLAEAVVEPRQITGLHKHLTSEEIYHITVGQGLMTLGERSFEVGLGDTVLIPPGTRHCIKNTGETPLKILCACTPAYTDADTVLL